MKKLFKVYQKIPHIVYADNVGDAIKILKSNIDNVMTVTSECELVEYEDQIPDEYLDALPYSNPQLMRTSYKGEDPNVCINLLRVYNKSKPKLRFEYCECGCHGSSVVVAGRELSIGQYDWDDKTNSFKRNHLYDGHTSSLSKIIGTFSSFEEASLKAEEVLEKDLNELKSKLGYK